MSVDLSVSLTHAKKHQSTYNKPAATEMSSSSSAASNGSSFGLSSSHWNKLLLACGAATVGAAAALLYQKSAAKTGAEAAASTGPVKTLKRTVSAVDVQNRAQTRHRLSSLEDAKLPASPFHNSKLQSHTDLPSLSRLSLEPSDNGPAIFRFVLTGGPCAGKTTALARLSSFLTERGFRVFTVPESATMMFSNGAQFSDLGKPGGEIAFQTTLFRVQAALEANFTRLALKTNQKAVIICDRGALDGKAYVTNEQWSQVMNNNGMTQVGIRDNRYDAVLHLVTAAQGAEEFYKLDNNEARTESPELARTVDKKLQEAWLGHPHQYIFDNSSNFEDKLRRVVDRLSMLVGLPSSIRSTSKFLLKKMPTLKTLPIKYEQFEVERVYLLHEEEDSVAAEEDLKEPQQQPPAQENYSFVRARWQSNDSNYGSYLWTTVKFEKGQKVEEKRIISGRNYRQLVLSLRDHRRFKVRQRRVTFIYDQNYYEVYQYRSPASMAGKVFLRCQNQASLSDDTVSQNTVIPPFLTVDRDVSGLKDYNGYEVSIKTNNEA